jgi:hypothetical protein
LRRAYDYWQDQPDFSAFGFLTAIASFDISNGVDFLKLDEILIIFSVVSPVTASLLGRIAAVSVETRAMLALLSFRWRLPS